MNSKENSITLNELLQIGLEGKIITFGDDNFNKEHNGYHLRGEIKQTELVNNDLAINLKWAEVLYNDSHSSDDWIPWERELDFTITLSEGVLYKFKNGAVYLKEKLMKGSVYIDRTFISIDMENAPKKKYVEINF